MLSTILSVFRKCQPVRIQAALVISYYKRVDIEGTAPGVGQGKELFLSVEDGVHPNPIACNGLRAVCTSPQSITFWHPWVGSELEAIG